ncbi:MAG: dihydrofolate reductase [Carnobacterium sp.]|uniref:Dihydrofolate reductase n=1 Tax=Carnobacterium antarcticum TaxID=2126436 RepID=A0ABW4NQH0_9LACT|nr:MULTISPECIES: dihydrofolate reductase [unclassified Carnobacterium]ALV21278.1 Dihydrofolate reductase [Carnobacterium sp. CP1]QQP69302.1 dihydrofolate reductase [Carnobacterium sp. CS13]
MIAFLWAQDRNGVIGNKGTLPWYLPNDLKYFKEMTQGNAVVMGRKTFEGMNKRPLPNRINIVMTNDKEYQAEGVLIMHSRQEVLDFAKDYENDLFITGGSGVFKEFMGDADLLHRTMIDGEFEGDTFIPEIDWTQWKLVNVEQGITDDRNKYPHQFETYTRN